MCTHVMDLLISASKSFEYFAFAHYSFAPSCLLCLGVMDLSLPNLCLISKVRKKEVKILISKYEETIGMATRRRHTPVLKPVKCSTQRYSRSSIPVMTKLLDLAWLWSVICILYLTRHMYSWLFWRDFFILAIFLPGPSCFRKVIINSVKLISLKFSFY